MPWAALAALTAFFRVLNRDLEGVRAAFATVILGIVAASFLALALVSFAPHLDSLLGIGDIPKTTEHAFIVTLVVMSAGAGAWRYLTERLNIEAEALEYRDARERFERAEKLLAADADPVSGVPRHQAWAQGLVHELGRLALAENEAWLKSRRERPLTPVVG
jgi:hypothetical protein